MVIDVVMAGSGERKRNVLHARIGNVEIDVPTGAAVSVENGLTQGAWPVIADGGDGGGDEVAFPVAPSQEEFGSATQGAAFQFSSLFCYGIVDSTTAKTYWAWEASYLRSQS